MKIRTLIYLAVGYAVLYYAVNILYHAYFGDSGSAMNPAPLGLLLLGPYYQGSSAGVANGASPATSDGSSDDDS
jgi:hypothetical protein